MNEQMGDEGYGVGTNNGDDAELYLLKWNSHQNHFANKFSEMLDEDDVSFADVTLACEGHFLQAHRVVLSVCSAYFKNLFKVNSAEKGPATIVLANIRYTDLENILHFIYRGQVNVRKEDLNKFLETGELLQIDGLMGQSAQNKQNSLFKRRYSEGGGQGQTTPRNLNQQTQSSFMGTRNRNLIQSPQGNCKVISGGVSRLSHTTENTSHGQNHLEGPVKRPRFSPPSGTTVTQQESPMSTTTPSRRPSTTTSVVHVNNNSNIATSSNAVKKMEESSPESNDNNGIKILSVASINASAAVAGEYNNDGNDVFEILDYDDDDRPENDVEIPEDLIGTYGDGGDDGVYYTYRQSSHTRSSSSLSQSFSQQSRLGGTVQGRYPSIIDGIHFELISADERKVAAQCKLCPGEKVIRGSGLTSSNFISHLRAFHKRELEEWREKRKTETRRRMD